jgi:hypothetical protein
VVGTVKGPSFPYPVKVISQPPMAVAPLSHSARDYVRAFDLTCIALWRDGGLAVADSGRVNRLHSRLAISGRPAPVGAHFFGAFGPSPRK